MKSYKLLLLSIAASAVSCVFFSCKKDSGSSTPAISIKDTTQTVNENAGTATVTVNLSAAQSQNVKLNVQISGDAILNGDYSVDSSSSITIPSGSTSASLKFTIFNDAVVETNKAIHVKFTSSGNVTLTNAEATVTIKDDDVSQAANGLQTDLLWDAGSLVNLDLFVVDSVVITNNEISDFNVVRGSQNPTGFETVLINNTDADGEYYLVVFYNEGSRAVNYTLNSNGPGITNEGGSDSFSATDSGAAVFYGPITKNGSTYSRQLGSNFNMSKVRSYLYRGKIVR